MAVHRRAIGDTLSPLSVTVKRAGAALPLDGFVVKFLMVDDDGVSVIDETDVGITVDPDQVNNPGNVDYEFSAAGVANSGTYYGYFRIYSGLKADTYPPTGIEIAIEAPTDDKTPAETIDIVSAANSPLRVRTEEGSIQERSLKDLIEADRYQQAKETGATNPPFGLRIARSQPGPFNGRA